MLGHPTATRAMPGLTRRELLRGVGGLALGAVLASRGVQRIAAQAEDGAEDDASRFAGVQLPPDVGQTSLHVYVPETGHTIRGSMLDYWRATGAAAVYGNPISEPFASADGYYSQAFERAVLQYRPDYIDTVDPIIRAMPIGAITPLRASKAGIAGRRGGDRRSGIWRALDPDANAVSRAVNAGGVFVEETGHTIAGQILAWYTANEGRFYLGHPLSEPIPERGLTVQHFEGALLMQAPDGSVRPAPLARELAPLIGFETKPVGQGDLPIYDEGLFYTGDNPNPQGDANAPGRRRVEVSIGEQRLWAFQGETLVMTTLVSTGIEPNHTEQGVFHVRIKFPKQDMQGFTDESGEVIGFGDDAPKGTIAYDVKDIPHVMYFDLDAEALHGCYWHENFGSPMSHGCVNLPLDVAAWMYGWAPLGTEVWVHE